MKTITLLGLEFVPLTLSHQEDLEGFLKKYPPMISGYTFAALIAWNQVYSYAWTFLENETLLILFYDEREGRHHLLQPLGNFSSSCQKTILIAMENLDYPCRISGVSNLFLQQYPVFCSSFLDIDDPARANYIYRTDDLATLHGRHFDKKRNLISQAERLYQWSIKPLTENCKPRCSKILMDLGPQNHSNISGILEQELSHELKALEFMMDHYEILKQKGCLITVDDRPAAFSIYEELTPQMAVVHFEKADREFKGLYQLINRETSKAILKDGYEFINREEDLGVKGLRQAKSSYFPIELFSFHVLTFQKNI